MIVLHLTDCPPGLRGDVTKWLLEIAAGVYVGQVSARVRDKLWLRVQETCRNGRAVLVYSTNNEQRLDFRIHGDTWEPIDFDGIKLMLRPTTSRLKAKQAERTPRQGFSDAARNRVAKRVSAARARYPDSYVVVDVETTGLNPDLDEIIELGAIRVIDGEKNESFCSFIAIDRRIPPEIVELTGITDDELKTSGRPLCDVMNDFANFLGNSLIVAHNLQFDKAFLDTSCVKCGLPIFTNRAVDTLNLARKLVKGVQSYKLSALAAHFGMDQVDAHRSLADCEMAYLLYQKLMDLM